MAQEALQKLNTRSQYTQTRLAARRDRTPSRPSGRSVLPSQRMRLSRTQANMMPADQMDAFFPNLGTIPQRPEQGATSAAMKRMLEVENKMKLQQDRQRIRAEMQAYKLPQMQVDESAELGQQDAMQQAFEDEYFSQLQTEEYMKAAAEQAQTTLGKEEARANEKRLQNTQSSATKQAQQAAEKVKQAIDTAGKIGWDTAEAIDLADAAEPADLEIPTIFQIIISMYRACTALLNNGNKLMPGFLSFIEPQPLFRFWSQKDISGAIQASIDDPMVGGGGVIENATESFLGWFQAIVGWYVVFVVVGQFIAILAFFLIIMLIFLRIFNIL